MKGEPAPAFVFMSLKRESLLAYAGLMLKGLPHVSMSAVNFHVHMDAKHRHMNVLPDERMNV